MGWLSTNDLRSVLSFLQEIYIFADARSWQARAVSALPKLVACDWVTYNEMDPGESRNENDVVSWPPLEEIETVIPEATRMWEHYMSEHAVLAYYHRTRGYGPVKISDFQSRTEFHRLGLYGDFYRKVGIEDVIALNFPAPSNRVFGIGLNRGRPYSEHDRLILKLVAPHLIQAYQTSQAASRLHQRLGLLSEMLEGLPYGVIALTREGRTELATMRARHMLDAYFGPRSGDRLPEDLENWVRQDRAALATTDELFAPRMPYTLHRDGRQLIVRLVRGRAQDLLHLEERATALLPESLRHLGLTRREAEVLVLVTQGKTNAGIGDALGTSPETVAKHLRHIYEKLGVRSRAAAATRALESVVSTSFHQHSQPALKARR